MQVGRESPHGLSACPFTPILFCNGRGRILCDHVHVHAPLSHPQRRLQRFDRTCTLGGGHTEAVLHHLQCAAAPVVLAVAAAMDSGVALLLEQLQHLLLGEVLRHVNREGDDQPWVARRRGALDERVEDRVRVVAPHRLAAGAAVESRAAREHQLQVIVQLGHGADRGARGAHRVGLVDGDRRRDAVDAVDRRLVHAVEELARVGGKGLHVAALTLGIERVEHQRGLARARHTGHDHQLVQRDRQLEVLQIVLPRALDADRPSLVGEVSVVRFHARERDGGCSPAKPLQARRHGGSGLFYRRAVASSPAD